MTRRKKETSLQEVDNKDTCSEVTTNNVEAKQLLKESAKDLTKSMINHQVKKLQLELEDAKHDLLYYTQLAWRILSSRKIEN